MTGDRGPNREDDEALVSEDIEATLVYDAYRASVEAGQPPDPEKLLAEHPALADRLHTLIAAGNLVASIAGDAIPNFVDYRIIRELGRGGMGIVYEAEQISRSRHVAIKVLTATAAMDPQQLKRFLHVEVPAAKLLRHRHIVPVVDFGCEHGVYYYAMQFIDGQNLAQLIKTPARFEGVESTEVDAASGVGVAHGEGIISSTQLPGLVQGCDCPGNTSRTRPSDPTNPKRKRGFRLPSLALRVRVPRVLPEIEPGQLSEPTRPFSSSGTRDRFRDAARWGLQAAEALDFAHQQGVVHRDIKPSNLLLDDRSNLWITDFGLAHIQGEAHVTATGDMTGTPRYMSPEQVRARKVLVDHRTDIYSLGVTLYELLTLRPAIDGDSTQDVMRRVIEEEPTAPRRIDPDIPRDLETIVLRAMAKERDDRYQTSRELADDLRRFSDHRPIQARRLSPLDRASRWARKHHKAVAMAIALLLTAVAGLSVVVVLISRAEKRAVGAELLAVSAKARAVAAEGEAQDRARESRYESLIQQILRLRLTSRSSGWSKDAWDLIREATILHPRDRGAFQAQAAGILIATDAHLVGEIPVPASSLTFDPSGRELWIGGLGQELRSWNSADGAIRTRGPAIEGPLAVRADGTVLQLGTTRDAKAGVSFLQLWDTAKQSAKVISLPDGVDRVVAHTISADGKYAGAVTESARAGRNILILETATGSLLSTTGFPATGVAFSPDASMTVAWDDAGTIGLWTLPAATPMATIPPSDTPIRSIGFGRARGLDAQKTVAERWSLAVGDAGGTVTLWDLKRRVPLNICRGSQYDVYAIAFSPDGTTMASAGRSQAKLWDVATGRLLLNMKYRNTMKALAFSLDGTKLAVGSQSAHGSKDVVDVYRLEDGRGIRTLRGLRGPVVKAIFSPNGRRVAGLSQDWQIAIWDQASGQLRITLDVPKGQTADNSGLAFSPDGKQFAFSAGSQATLWDVESGKLLRPWTLPEGMVDALAFLGPDQLSLLRRESTDVRFPLSSTASFEDHPRVMRLRNLLGARSTKPVRVITDFNRIVHAAAASPDGKCFVVEGVGGLEEDTRSVNAYDVASGARLWSYPSRLSHITGSSFKFDPAGKILCLNDRGGHSILLEIPTLAPLGDLEQPPRCLSPGGRRWLSLRIAETADRCLVYSLHDRGRQPPLLQVAINSTATSSVLSQFSPDGRHVIWGNSEGSVSICDLDEVNRRLAEFDLGW